MGGVVTHLGGSRLTANDEPWGVFERELFYLLEWVSGTVGWENSTKWGEFAFAVMATVVVEGLLVRGEIGSFFSGIALLALRGEGGEGEAIEWIGGPFRDVVGTSFVLLSFSRRSRLSILLA